MQKSNCSELHNQLAAITTKRTAIEDLWRSLMEKRSENKIDLHGVRELQSETKQLRRLVDDGFQLVGVRKLSAKTKEGVEVKFELKERLEYWRKFYKAHGVDWVELPNRLIISHEQAQSMEQLMAEGFDFMLIIPEGLVDEYRKEIDPVTGWKTAKNKKYADLHRLMSKDYAVNSRGSNYNLEGNYVGASDKKQGFRIILTKAVQNLEDDELLKTTQNKSVEELEGLDGLLTLYEGLGESEYLVFALAYWEDSRKTKHLDEKGGSWLPGSIHPEDSERVLNVRWGGERLVFYLDDYNFCPEHLGCRLARSFN